MPKPARRRAPPSAADADAPHAPPAGAAAEPAGAEPLSQLVRDRVRQMRAAKGWTLEQLATASGVSRSMLSQIERGLANPTLGVAWRIARAFGLKLAELVDAPETVPHIDVVRASDRATLFRDDAQCRIRTLSPLHLEKDVEFYELRLHGGGVLESAPHFAGTREFLTVEQGALRVTSGAEQVELAPGDSAHYPADIPHRIENLRKTPAAAFLVVIYTGKR